MCQQGARGKQRLALPIKLVDLFVIKVVGTQHHPHFNRTEAPPPMLLCAYACLV
jgi:hypothetical protein